MKPIYEKPSDNRKQYFPDDVCARIRVPQLSIHILLPLATMAKIADSIVQMTHNGIIMQLFESEEESIHRNERLNLLRVGRNQRNITNERNVTQGDTITEQNEFVIMPCTQNAS